MGIFLPRGNISFLSSAEEPVIHPSTSLSFTLSPPPGLPSLRPPPQHPSPDWAFTLGGPQLPSRLTRELSRYPDGC